MAKTTNMQALRRLAKSFLHFEPEPTEYAPVIIHHPFTTSALVALKQPDGSQGIGNILENPKDPSASLLNFWLWYLPYWLVSAISFISQ